ncbi:MAG: hypothetical protein ACKV2Q_06775 [Planctomycetaceae bacterium]
MFVIESLARRGCLRGPPEQTALALSGLYHPFRLLDRPSLWIAIKSGWVWVGTDLSEAAGLTEERIAIRLLADMAAVTSLLVIGHEEIAGVGFAPETSRIEVRLDYETLVARYQKTPGLVVDRLKSVLEFVWSVCQRFFQSSLKLGLFPSGCFMLSFWIA